MSSITWDTARVPQDAAYGAITLFDGPFQILLLSIRNPTSRSRNPTGASTDGLGSFPFARRYLGNQLSFSFPRVTEMFHFSRFSLIRLCIQRTIMRYKPHRVSPFGIPRIKVCLRLPGAYRRLPRPSSPTRAKSSTRKLLVA